MAPSPTTSTKVILSSSKDYDDWIEVIKTAALEFDIWKYIDPSQPQATLPTAPERPVPSMVSGPIINATDQTQREPRFSDLDADQREQLRWLNADYNDNKRRYNKQTEALAKIRTRIQDTVDPMHFVYTKAPSPYDVLVRLAKRFQLTDYAKKQELRTTWLGLQKSTKVTDVDAWLQAWETTYDKCLEHDLPEVQAEWPITSFVATLSTVSPDFANVYAIDQAKETEPTDFRTVL